MALAVCLLFDESGDRVLRRLWDRLEEQGIGSLRSHTHGRHHPHLSLAVLSRWDLHAVRSAVEALPPGGPVQLTFHASATFRRGRSWLVPGVTADFVRRQQQVYAAVIGAGAVVHEHYTPGRWVPHCSLAPRARLDQLPALTATVNEVLPLSVTTARAALIDSATGEVLTLRQPS